MAELYPNEGDGTSGLDAGGVACFNRGMNANEAYRLLIDAMREISTLDSLGSLLSWDEEVLMPAKGAENRSRQMGLVAKLSHEKLTSPRIGEWLAAVEGSDLVEDPESDAAANAREIRRQYDRAVKLPGALVEEMARTAVLAQKAWEQAKKQSDYPTFEPWLGKTLDLVRQQARCLGYQKHMYDALLDIYEPGETTENVRRVFDSLLKPLVDLVGKITSSGRQAPLHILERSYPVEAQQRLGREAAAMVGFDFEAGRLDVSVHPFCCGVGPGDTRMTTRFDPNYFGDAFFSVLHETGHSLYDQGLPAEHYGTPLGEAVSLGIHESQSRMWENLVGRSRAFWRFFMPKLRAAFPQATADVAEDQWIFAVNDVRPSLIRTESDEVTYNLHVALRFELEQSLLSGDLKTADLPGVWKEKMKQYVGVEPTDDAHGCLQDVHWSHGSVGYFPTYTLGNLYAAQFYETAKQQLPDLEARFERGQFGDLLGWLRQNIHRHGRRFTAPQLVKRITGRELSAEPLLRHLAGKAKEFYGV